MLDTKAGRIAVVTFIVLIVVAQAGYIALIAPFTQGPDERDHFDHVSFIAHEGRLPDPAEERVGQAQHPPLPYAMTAIGLRVLRGVDEGMDDDTFGGDVPKRVLGRMTAFRPGRTNSVEFGIPPETGDARVDADLRLRRWTLHALRVPSLLLGVIALIFLYRSLVLVFDRPKLAALGTVFVATIPGFCFQSASLSNDPWVTAIAAVCAWLVLRARKRGTLGETKTLLVIAAVLGLGFLTKLQIVGIASFVTLIALGACPRRAGIVGKLRVIGLLAAGPLVIAGWWHVRQYLALDGFLAADRHAEHEAYLLRLGEYHAVDVIDFVSNMAISFFGTFGQGSLKTHAIYYFPVIGLAALALAGGFVRERRRRTTKVRRAPRRGATRKRSRRASGDGENEDDGEIVTGTTTVARGGDTSADGDDEIVSSSSGADSESEADSDATPSFAPPFAASVLSIVLLLGLLSLSNVTYYHFHGRYLFAVMVPIAIVLVEGLRRLLGSHTDAILTTATVWNVAFLAFATFVVITNHYSVPAAKFDRGRIAHYVDSGHGWFDQKTAGGAAFTRSHAQLSLPRHTMRQAAQVAGGSPALRYEFAIPDPTRRYQVRVRYPSPSGARRGDLPVPTANVMIADGEIVHGPHSLWNGLGELRFDLPTSVTADGNVAISWTNVAPGGSHVSCAEIWIEEAWISMQAGEEPRVVRYGGREVVEFVLENIDAEEAHHVMVFLEDTSGNEIVADPELADGVVLGAGEKEAVRITLPDDAPTDRSTWRVRIVDVEQTNVMAGAPWASVKLAPFKGPDAVISGSMNVPDIETVRVRLDAERRVFADVAIPRLGAGRYTVGVTHAEDFDLMSGNNGKGVIHLEAGGADVVDGSTFRRSAGHGDGLLESGWTIVKSGEEGAVTLRLFAKSAGISINRLEFDRVIVRRVPGSGNGGRVYAVEGS